MSDDELPDPDVAEEYAEAEAAEAEVAEAEAAEAEADGDEGGSESSGDSDGQSSGGDSEEPGAAEPREAEARPARPASRTVRVVPPEEHVTSDLLQLTEAAAILAVRAAQIDRSGIHFAPAGATGDAVRLAYEELVGRGTPLLVRRRVGVDPDGTPVVEDWNVRDMTLPDLHPP